MERNRLNRTAPTPRPAEYNITPDVKAQIDHIATLLPATCEEYDTITQVPGIELQNKGIIEVKRHNLIVPVELSKVYDVPGVALRNVNHVLKLRKFYRTGGMLGVHQYLNTLPEYESEMRAKYPSLWKSGMYIGVKEGTLLLPDSEYLKKVEAVKQMNLHIQNQ